MGQREHLNPPSSDKKIAEVRRNPPLVAPSQLLEHQDMFVEEATLASARRGRKRGDNMRVLVVVVCCECVKPLAHELSQGKDGILAPTQRHWQDGGPCELRAAENEHTVYFRRLGIGRSTRASTRCPAAVPHKPRVRRVAKDRSAASSSGAGSCTVCTESVQWHGV